MEDTSQYEKVDTYRGYRYAVWLNAPYGYRCGYVEIPENHPFYLIPYRDFSDKIESIGLDFSGRIKGLSGWFIGWDHHHYWDAIDEQAVLNYYKDLPEDKRYEKLEYAKSFVDYEGLTSYCDDVERECHNIIDELIKIERN